MRILITIATACGQALYAVMKLAPVRRKVVLLSRQADRPSRDFRMLAEELERRDPGLRVVTRCRFIRPGILARVAYFGEVLAQMWHLATSAVCVVDGYIVPVSVFTHRPELTVIQMWHALGAIKRFGLQSVGREGGRSEGVAESMRMHRNYDVVICGGPDAVPAFAEAFSVSESQVLPLGLPRVDYVLEQAEPGAAEPPAIAELRARFPRLGDEGRTRVLYAPTFRRGRAAAFDSVVRAFDDERYTLIVKPHDLVSAATSGAHVVDATGVDALDLLTICDVAVTDYSAIAFEAAVADKPVHYFVPDIEEYRLERGLNIDPMLDMPEVSSESAEAVRARIDAGGDTALSAVRELRRRYLPPADGGTCTGRIADLVAAKVEEGASDGG